MVARKDNSEYFKKRRETIGQFSVSVKREKLEALERKRSNQDCMVKRKD